MVKIFFILNDSLFMLDLTEYESGSNTQVRLDLTKIATHRYAWVRTHLEQRFGDASFTSFVKMIVEKGKKVSF